MEVLPFVIAENKTEAERSFPKNVAAEMLGYFSHLLPGTTLSHQLCQKSRGQIQATFKEGFSFPNDLNFPSVSWFLSKLPENNKPSTAVRWENRENKGTNIKEMLQTPDQSKLLNEILH